MQTVIHTANDAEGLQMALVALFEESFQRSSLAESMRMADAETRQRMLDEMEIRNLSPGYYTRASYLLDLGSAIETGITYAAGDLTREDVRGLQVLSRAKAEFEREHPQCGNCGTRQDSRFAHACRGCKMKFARGDD